MTKPTFLSIISRGWDGSSPFAYTLQRIANYAHFGYTKNHHTLLNEIEVLLNGIDSSPTIKPPVMVPRILNNTWENYEYNHGHKMNLTSDLEPLKDFPLHHFEKSISLPHTSLKYTNYHLALYHHVSSKGYKAVADFLTPNNNDITFKLLKQHFNLLGILLLRDPVRRAIGNCLYKFNKLVPNMDPFFSDYVRDLDITYKCIPNTLTIIMEELWEDNGKSLLKLSQFLNHPIPELWPNLYSPDIGHHLTWDLDNVYCPVPCQPVNQSSFIITPEYYNELRNKYSYIYDNWIERFGSLPLNWGKPIDYDKNLQTYPHYKNQRPL
jgi:hypothetical protein